jgi:hypothetical protein
VVSCRAITEREREQYHKMMAKQAEREHKKTMIDGRTKLLASYISWQRWCVT